ncbi:uncharacterized protein F5147DRAFT_694377 [Suillus discolor]|uniref:Secreted protein n=1 Tax=Suillus discolor TaxID=1912936 RepID=A0A9P7JUM0_9AGAM|nr:uncharacterized protein F5147DRAFT_694377 [Suillus discolor]KAG2108683.1 hypothetical protein F5147DRAFT_694377 [Suillus discolor]
MKMTRRSSSSSRAQANILLLLQCILCKVHGGISSKESSEKGNVLDTEVATQCPWFALRCNAGTGTSQPDSSVHGCLL